MSRIRAVLDRLNDLEATIIKVERQSKARESDSIRLTLRSLEERRSTLKEKLHEVAREESLEVCDYRMIPTTDASYAIAAVTSSLKNFQDLVISTFDAITDRPKKRMTSDPIVLDKTRLDFGFAYAGSLGIVMTVPNHRRLAVDSDLDEAIKAIFEILKLTSTEEVRGIADAYGTATVRKLFAWSKINSEHGLGVDIKWIRDGETFSQVLAQPEELEETCRLIAAKGKEESEPAQLTGTLEKWDIRHRAFTLAVPDADPISGTFDKSLDVTVVRHVPGRYRAFLNRRTVINFTSDDERTYWDLEKLEEL